jgi:D-arabinose 1-dehydrogenase-like Zn-dependent alcohol dehydrogenase
MLDFVGKHKIVPVIDTTLPLLETEQALRRMNDGKQFGKIILTIAHN